MQSRSLLVFGLSIILFLSVELTGSAAESADAATDFFEKEVRPILVEKCSACHGDVQPKAKLKLTSRSDILQGGDSGPAIVPHKPDESLLIKVVRYQDKPRMPPTGKLAARQIEILERWVKMGAPWPGAKESPMPTGGGFAITEKHRQFWSFQPVRSPALPEIRNHKSQITSDIDRFIFAKLEAKGITLAVPADKRTLLRRATFDLIGLPPTPEEIDAFLTDDSPKAFAKVVDRLLASPLYGERWGRHWLDVVRYADARDLIQLPPASDFREAWRYRDWVVDSFNRDLPYSDFVRSQVAGDLLPLSSGAFNKDGLVATGLLAIADFVPGDVDKNQMIADYVNDQIDVVGRSFLGLSIACARCHDHKFDPISTEDYYALSGIFFSTRIVPGPVPGNTPLVRVPLLSPSEIAQIQTQTAVDARRRAELERLVPDAVDRAYRAHLTSLLNEQAARYLMAACECRAGAKPTPGEIAKRHGLQEGALTEWVALLDRIDKQPLANYPLPLREAAAGKLSGPDLEKAAAAIQKSLGAQVMRDEAEAARARGMELAAQYVAGVVRLPVAVIAEAWRLPRRQTSARAALIHFRADDPQLATNPAGRVTDWPNRAGLSGDATPPVPGNSPTKTTAKIGGHNKTVLRFDGQSLLEAPYSVPSVGSLFVVFQTATNARAGERLIGWEDADIGKHGLGVMIDPSGRLQAILRKDGKSGDLQDSKKATGFETVCITWGPSGTTLRRNGIETVAPQSIDGISSDPKITSLKIGGPGSGGSPRFHGDVAELRVYSRQMNEIERKQVEAELRETWFQADDPKKLLQNPPADFYAELLSPRGPFWPSLAERTKRLAPEVQKQIEAMNAELIALRNKRPMQVPQAVVAQDGGPKGTRHEGFKDAHVFIRGDHNRLGKTVPRGFPKVLTGERAEKITEGSGRLQLADWLTRPENPLSARVMVNRIWQHHFGEGLVRTPNDFGERGERPTHPELLDLLATRFIESKWSVKAMHRLIMLSAVYQQSSKVSAATLASDPDNRLFGRMNRQRLEAEAIRDSLLAVSGRLDPAPGGPPFTDLATPRRTLYLMSARTGANTSDFGRLFDRADPSLIVARRGQSVVAPQALFFLNDPFVSGTAKALAARLQKEAPPSNEARIKHLYALTLGRSPTKAEVEIGMELLTAAAISGRPDPLERYCLLVLSTNEFLYID